MSNSVTILDCVLQVVGQSQKPMSAKEICDAILKQNLYSFNTDDPLKKDAATTPGARQIMLFDGEEIVNLMLQKNFGVNISRNLPIYDYTFSAEHLK